MKLELPNSVVSPQDVTSLLFEIKDYSKWYMHESIKAESHIKNTRKSPELTVGAKELINKWSNKGPLNRERLDELIEILDKYNDKAPTVHITLAAPATDDIKSNLANWFRNNIANNILINFSFNRNLLGGMIIRIGSRIFDWSFRRQILDRRDILPEVARNV